MEAYGLSECPNPQVFWTKLWLHLHVSAENLEYMLILYKVMQISWDLLFQCIRVQGRYNTLSIFTSQSHCQFWVLHRVKTLSRYSDIFICWPLFRNRGFLRWLFCVCMAVSEEIFWSFKNSQVLSYKKYLQHGWKYLQEETRIYPIRYRYCEYLR